MAVIISISGIRGTIGGQYGNNLTPIDIVKYTTAYTMLIKEKIEGSRRAKIVVGRDARLSGNMIKNIVIGTLISLGVDVIDIDLSPTPTVELAVEHLKADGGIIITASHNPIEWNALKLLNSDGNFISEEESEKVSLYYKNTEKIVYSDVFNLGKIEKENFIKQHIHLIRNLDLVNVSAIEKANFKVAIDCINSVGSIAIPLLLKELGVREVYTVNCVANGIFAHNPEPLPEHLRQLSDLVKNAGADVGFAVDPDVDRLAIVNEDGSFFGEEYTVVAIADYVLSHRKGATVSNLSSSMALKELTEKKYGQSYYAAKVGEVNVVKMMKSVHAVIGGEGNGGVIYPKLHYGRDALVGIALFLSFLAEKQMKPSELRKLYPNYVMIKDKRKIENVNIDEVFAKLKDVYKETDTTEGLKIFFDRGWVHIRKSNTEPIIRIYSEAENYEKAQHLIDEVLNYAGL